MWLSNSSGEIMQLIKELGCYKGLVFIGDLHLAGRNVGFRKDIYPETMLSKLAYALDLAKKRNYLPLFLGDLFHWPKDNPNWILVKLCQLLETPLYGIYGNHDCSTNQLSINDSLEILIQAGRFILLDDILLSVTINSQSVLVGGCSWNREISKEMQQELTRHSNTVFWLFHQDWAFQQTTYFGKPLCNILGVDFAVNGHIHLPYPDEVMGSTHWFNPGSLTRISRDKKNRDRAVQILAFEYQEKWQNLLFEVPHQRFEDVFYLEEIYSESEMDSAFIQGLYELENIHTETYAGFTTFLDKNIGQFREPIQDAIRELSEEILYAD